MVISSLKNKKIMKKLAILITAIILITFSGFSQEVLIFNSMFPKPKAEPIPMTLEQGTAIWNVLLYYPSIGACQAGIDGQFAYSDLKKVYEFAEKTMKEYIKPFLAGTAVKVQGSIDNTDPENVVVTETVYWDRKTEVVAFRKDWRTKNKDRVVDITAIWLAHRTWL